MENFEERTILTKKEAVEFHIAEALRLLGFDLKIADNGDTPKRIAKMWINETARNIDPLRISELDMKMTLFDNPSPESVEMIIVRDIPFNSMCSHHFMPFFGKVTVAYIPNKTIIGLSKIPRIAQYFSKKPQVQENLTSEIAEYLYEITDSLFVGVLIHDSTHTCMSCRGVELPSSTETYYQKVAEGFESSELRKEFFSRCRI